MKRFLSHAPYLYGSVFVLSWILCIWGSWSYPIYVLDEAKNAEAAREMFESGNYLVPYFNGQLRTDKPPLHYYFMSLGFSIFGVSAFAARFFSALFGALTMLVSFFCIDKYSNRNTALISLLIFWPSLMWIQEFHLAVPDPYLIFFVSSGLWCFYGYYREHKKVLLVFAYLLFSLGALVKGPVAIGLPALSVLLFLMLRRELTFDSLKHLQLHWALLIFLVVAVPWYVMVHLETAGIWTRGFFLEHNLDRFQSEREGHGGSILVTLGFVLLGLLPFSLALPFLVKSTYLKRKESLMLYASSIVLVFLMVFGLASTKLPNYTMPCYPFLVYIIADFFQKKVEKGTKTLSLTVCISLIALIGVVLPFASRFALNQDDSLKDLSDLSFWIIPVSILSLVALLIYMKNRLKESLITLGLAWILLIPIFFSVLYPKLNQKNPVQRTLVELGKDKNYVVYKRMDPAFPFNFKRTFEVLRTKEEVTSHFKKNPGSYLLTNTREIPEWFGDFEMILEQKALFESNTTRIYKRGPD